MNSDFGIFSVLAFLIDAYHILDLAGHYNTLVVQGTMTPTQYYSDLTNSFLFLIPIILALRLVFKKEGDK